ncbi:FGGY-family carbohydrate kinase [Dinoroseobacter sp. S124A]|uniref:FGGY-family carbohydrate kinase n=1 Tax=Dinoroseobacter sp. S124A TaxID=3415128 RepID=UPI003C7C9891
MTAPYFIGVDVGTGSARAGVFDAEGTLLASHKHAIAMWREAGEIAEQSSDDIWAAVCTCVIEARARAGVPAAEIAGVGFDAACSLVVLGPGDAPISVSASADPRRNVIVWMDHRALDQADRINATGHPVLTYVGGRISPEMQTPKLLWLQESMPETFAAATRFFDLPDFLTWSATGSLARSACTVTCKWTYLAHEDRWDDSYFEAIGLNTLPREDYARIGQTIVAPGAPLGQGLSPQAAAAMDLRPGIPVGAGLIDAHAGGLGTVGADPERGPEQTMAYVFGTSACTMASSTAPQRVPGVWGPYFSAMIPDLWLSEGGQSAAGEAIAHLIHTHPAAPEATARAEAGCLSLQAALLRRVTAELASPSDAVTLVGPRLIVPDLLGNRAPFADPNATGIISGLTLDTGEEDLLRTYLAAVFGVGYGLRQIMEAQAAHGVRPTAIAISGGAGESPAIQQLLADAAGVPVLSTACPEPVLLGAAMLGAVAGGAYPGLTEAMSRMSRIASRKTPVSGPLKARHDARYTAYCALQKAERTLRSHAA